MVYTFENICHEDKELKLNDDAIKIFVNTKGKLGEVSEEFKELLSFIDTSEDRSYNNELANDLLKELKSARTNEKWRHGFMMWSILMEDAKREAQAEGRAEGKTQANFETISRMLSAGKTPETIADFCGFTMEEIQAVQEKMAES